MADIRVPTLGESVTEATIGKWFKQPGDAVAVDEPLVELETDKVTLEVPAPAAGVLSDIAVKTGDTIAVGALLGQIKEGAAAAPKATAPTFKPAETPKPAPAAPARSTEMPMPPSSSFTTWRDSFGSTHTNRSSPCVVVRGEVNVSPPLSENE